MDVFEKNPGLGVVGHGYYAVDLDTPQKVLIEVERIHHLTLNEVADARRLNAICDLFGTSKLAVRKEVLDRILPVPEELIFMADAFIFYFATAAAGAVALPNPLCYYRVHAQNLYETKDRQRTRRRLEMQKCLVASLLEGSPRVEAPRLVRAALAEPWILNTERSLLSREGGSPWRTFQAEWATYRLCYSGANFGYKLFKAFVLVVTLVIPPRWFYQLKLWYGKMGLRRYREKVGNAVPAEPIRVRRERVASEI